MTLAHRFEIRTLTWDNVGTTKDGPAGWWNTAARPDPTLSKQKGAGVKPTHSPVCLVTPGRPHLAVEVVR
jgi:hypothetical protein